MPRHPALWLMNGHPGNGTGVSEGGRREGRWRKLGRKRWRTRHRTTGWPTGNRNDGCLGLGRSETANVRSLFISEHYKHLLYLGQGGQQPLRVVQGGPAVRQTVGHVSQLLPDWRKSDLDVAQARPVQLAPAFQITEHRQSLAVQLLKDSGRCSVKSS